MESILALYRDPLFFWFPLMSTIVSMGSFFVFAAPLTLIAWLDPPSQRKYRIQAEQKTTKKILLPSLRYWLLNNLVMLALVVLAWPLARHSGIHIGPLPAFYVVIAEVLLFIYLDDFLFYWMHRAFHSNALYKRFHMRHHLMPAPWACAAHYMHPVEFVATGALVLIGPSLLGVHVVTLWIWIAFRQWEAAEGHSGYSFPWDPSRLFPGNGGGEFHDFHHAKFRGNYAGFNAHLDGIFGTLAKGYEEHMAKKKAALHDAPQRTSR